MLHAALTISPSAATAGPNIPLAWLPHPALSHIYWIKPSPSLSIASHPLSPLHGYIPSVDSGLGRGWVVYCPAVNGRRIGLGRRALASACRQGDAGEALTGFRKKTVRSVVGVGRRRRCERHFHCCQRRMDPCYGLVSQVLRVARFSRRRHRLGINIPLFRNGVADFWQWVVSGDFQPTRSSWAFIESVFCYCCREFGAVQAFYRDFIRVFVFAVIP